MDLIAELLPPSYLLKSENTSKDKRKNKTPYQKKYAKKFDDTEAITSKTAISDWGDVDRRKGGDRRKELVQRGRFLESRERNDRRASKFDIFVKI